MKITKFAICIVMTLVLSSCGKDGLNVRTTRNNIEATSSAGMATDTAGGCGCTLQFNPVCGTDGKTYDSPCVANCLGIPYTFGACDNNGSMSCSSTVQYVCGQPPMPSCSAGTTCAQVLPSPKAYLNLCQLVEANAQYLSNGVCP